MDFSSILALMRQFLPMQMVMQMFGSGRRGGGFSMNKLMDMIMPIMMLSMLGPMLGSLAA